MLEVAVCDDNNEDLRTLTEMLKNIFSSNNTVFNLQVFSSAEKMLHEMKYVDIGILDISMEKLNGIELGRKLKSKFPDSKLIYTTSFQQYCMQAINEVHAFAFLCKPLEKNKMEKQLMELVEKMEGRKDRIEKMFYMLTDSNGKKHVSLKLNLRDIIYFEYIKSKRRVIITLENDTYEMSYVMEKLVEELKEYGFAINCRGYLVNLHHVIKIRGYNIHLDNEKVLPLSQKRVAEFKEVMNNFVHNNR